MINKISTLTFLIPSLLLTSACNSGDRGMVGQASLFGITEDGIANKEVELPYLSSEEQLISKDSSYQFIENQILKGSYRFNNIDWPLNCTDQSDECKNSPDKKLNLRDVTIRGKVLIIDASQTPWLALQNKKNLRSLTVEAEKIIVRSSLKVPGASVKIRASQLIVEKEGLINNTPLGFLGGHPAFPGGAKAIDGLKGQDGSPIIVEAEALEILGDQAPRFIAHGGSGQDAGLGRGQIAGPHGTAVDENGKEIPREQKTAMETYKGDYCRKFPLPRVGGVGGGAYEKCLKQKGQPYENKIVFMAYWRHGAGVYIPVHGAGSIPEHGVSAIPGGKQGAGGNGGKITLSVHDSNVNTSQLVSVKGGSYGASDKDRLGTLGQMPRISYKVFLKAEGPIERVEGPFESKDGLNATAPKSSVSEAAEGTIEVKNKQIEFSKTFYELALKRIKEHYYNRQWDKAAKEINDFDSRFARMEKEESERQLHLDAVAKVAARITQLRESIRMQKDYFGRGLADAPKFSFEFNMKDYESEVQKAMRAYYLASLFKKDNQANIDKQAYLQELLKMTEEGIFKSSAELREGRVSVSNITYRINQVEKAQKRFEGEVKYLRETIDAVAEDIVRRRHQPDEVLAALDKAVSIAQVIPVLQPELGIGTQLIKTVVHGPEANTLEGWLKYGSSIKDQATAFGKEENFKASQESWNNFKQRFSPDKLNSLDFKGKVNYLQELYGDVKDLASQIDSINGASDQPTYPASEVEAEIQKLIEKDETLKKTVESLNELLQAKMQLQKDLMVYSQLVANLAVQIDDFIFLGTKASDATLDSSWMNDEVMQFTFQRMADEAEERVLYLYDETVRSFNYLTLRKYSTPISLLTLRYKAEQSLKSIEKNEANPNTASKLAAEILGNLYLTQLDEIKAQLRQEVEVNRALRIGSTEKRVWALNEQQLEKLNKEGFVDIELTEGTFMNRENARIKSIALSNDSNKVAIENTGGLLDTYVSLNFSLANRGTIKLDGTTHEYVYPGQLNQFVWENSLQFDGDSYKNEVTQRQEIKGILSSLLDKDQKLSEYSSVFSTHAGLTKMRVSAKVNGKVHFKKLAVIIEYTYSL